MREESKSGGRHDAGRRASALPPSPLIPPPSSHIPPKPFARNVSIIFGSNVWMLACGIVTSLLSARALGAEGRGDLALVVLYPNVIALVAGFGLPQAHRFCAAREPRSISALFSNSLLFASVAGLVAFGAAELFLPLLVGERTPFVMRLARLYMVNTPAALLHDLMRGLLEGAQRFESVSLARILFFGVQACGYALLYGAGRLTIAGAASVMILAQMAATCLLVWAVWRDLRPRWQPSRAVWQDSLRFGLRGYPGVLTEFTTMRLDQLVLGRFAESSAIGLYFVAVRLSEITTVLASSVADVVMPRIARAGGGSGDGIESREAGRVLARSLRLTACAQAVVLVPLWLGAPLLLQALYGAEFRGAAGVLRLLLVASMVWSAGAIVIGGLNGLGRPQASTAARLAAAVVTIVLLALLLPAYGITGAGVASLAGYATMLLVALGLLVRGGALSWSQIVRPHRSEPRYERVRAEGVER